VEDREAARERLSQLTVVTFALATTAVFVTGLIGGRGGLGVLAAGMMVASVVAAELLKEVLPRPGLTPGPAWLLRNSFPSGSAAVATSIAVGSFLVAPDRLRWLVLPLGALYAAVIGEAIQSSGWHRLSDTIGGCLLVVALASALLALFARAGLVHRSDRGRVNPRIGNALVIGAVVALLVGAVLVVLPGIFPLLATPEGSRRAFLQSAFPLIGAGLTVLAISLFARLVEPYTLGRGGTGGDGGLPLPRRIGATGSDGASASPLTDADQRGRGAAQRRGSAALADAPYAGCR
jgi:hypothetical protein